MHNEKFVKTKQRRKKECKGKFKYLRGCAEREITGFEMSMRENTSRRNLRLPPPYLLFPGFMGSLAEDSQLYRTFTASCRSRGEEGK